MADKGVAAEEVQDRTADAIARNTETIPTLNTGIRCCGIPEKYRNKIPVLDFLEYRKIPEKYRVTVLERPVF